MCLFGDVCDSSSTLVEDAFWGFLLSVPVEDAKRDRRDMSSAVACVLVGAVSGALVRYHHDACVGCVCF